LLLKTAGTKPEPQTYAKSWF